MKSLFELRKEAQAMGIEDYASMSKETLAKVIAEHSPAGSTVVETEPEEDLSAEELAIIKAAEEEAAAEEKMTPVERLAARNAKLKKEKEEKADMAVTKKAAKAEKAAADRQAKEDAKIKAAADKEAAKAEKEAADRQSKEAAKAEKAAEKAAAKAEKRPKIEKTQIPKASTAFLNFTPKGEKPEFRSGMSGLIYDTLLLNDGRSYGVIAKDLGSHYNMVRRVAEMYFKITVTAMENITPASAQQTTKEDLQQTEVEVPEEASI